MPEGVNTEVADFRPSSKETMNKIVISCVVMFFMTMALGFVVHAMLLHGEYEASGLMRALEDQNSKFAFMIVAHAMIAIGFTLVYRRGREDKPWLGQGVRYGLLWSCASLIPTSLINYVVMPYELSLISKQIAFGTPAVVLMGIVVAALNRGPAPAHSQ